ncbi:hypothetical protein QFC21_000783 [Naganishia friedmannii]|uniref:Uncharacterized protein n=1 Tax=Naganishia friedmannii TaxID=89922 RepID=A0ACC2W6H8_9TREE|nr:hypothetical protein QFC21_000783 [Naganishia friedmannii]
MAFVVAVNLVVAVSESSLWATLAAGSISKISVALGCATGEGILGAIGAEIFEALLAQESDAPTRKGLERLGEKIVQNMEILELERHKSDVSAVAHWWADLLRTLNGLKVAGRLVDYRTIQKGVLVPYNHDLLAQISILPSIMERKCRFDIAIQRYSAMLNFPLQTSNM